MYHRVGNMNRGSFHNPQLVGGRPQNFDARFDQYDDRMQANRIQTNAQPQMRHYTQNQQPAVMQVYDFSVGLKHEQRDAEGVEGEGAPRRLLQIVLNMMPTKQVRLHVYDCDDPRDVAYRLTVLLQYKNLLQLTEPNNINLFREAL